MKIHGKLFKALGSARTGSAPSVNRWDHMKIRFCTEKNNRKPSNPQQSTQTTSGIENLYQPHLREKTNIQNLQRHAGIKHQGNETIPMAKEMNRKMSKEKTEMVND